MYDTVPPRRARTYMQSTTLYIDCRRTYRTQPGHCTRPLYSYQTDDSLMVSRLIVVVHNKEEKEEAGARHVERAHSTPRSVWNSAQCARRATAAITGDASWRTCENLPRRQRARQRCSSTHGAKWSLLARTRDRRSLLMAPGGRVALTLSLRRKYPVGQLASGFADWRGGRSTCTAALASPA